jgi:hypothetical protein
MTIKKTLILLALAGIGLASCQPKTAAPTEPAPGTGAIDTTGALDVATATKYVGNYKPRAGEVDSIQSDGTHVKLPNTRSVWFSKEKLQAMLNALDKEKDGDGVRFYFAAYNPRLGMAAKDSARRYDGYNTLVMVSTIKKDTLGQKGLHWDSYIPLNGKPTGIIGAGPENRGEICPPPSNCPSVGATLIK